MIVLLVLLSFLIWSQLKPKQEIVFWSIFMCSVFFIAFFFGLTNWLSLVILLSFVGIRIHLSERVWTKESSIALLISIPFLLTATMPTRFLDAGSYYEQSARWFQHGIPKGLGNFDVFLMQSSMAHSNEALLNSILGVGQNEVSILISIFLISIAFSRIKKINWAIGLLAFIVFGVLVHFTQSSSSDFLLIAFITYYFLERPRAKRGTFELISIIVILPFIKPVGAGLSVLLALELFNKTRFKYAWVLALAAVLFVLKNFWVSGWLPIIGEMPVSFSIPTEAKTFLKFTNTFYDYEGRNSLPFNLDLVFGFLYFLLISVQAYLRKLQNKPWVTEAIFHLLILSYWVFKAPAGRYLFPFFVVILISMPLRKNFYQRKVIYLFFFFTALGLFSVLPTWNHVLTGARAQRFFAFGGFKNVHWTTPSPLWQPKTKPIILDGNFTCNLPVEPYQCFDATFPCNPKIMRYYNGDSVYLPVFNAFQYSFSYRSLPVGDDTQALLDSLTILPQFPLKTETPE